MSRVLVTGGAGFIGANLCARLLAERGASVRVLDDLSTGRIDNLQGLDVELVEGSVADPTTVAAATEGVDAVAHLAALPSVPRSIADPVASHTANVTGTLTVLEAARAEGAYVLSASSSSVYGATETLPKHPDLPTRPRSPYAAGKLAAEAYTLAYAHSYDLETCAFRFFNVFGPLQAPDHAYAAVVPRFLDAALAGRPLEIHGDGEQSRDFTSVATVTEVLAAALADRTTSADPVNLAYGTRTTVNDLAARVGRVVGVDLEVVHTEPRPGDVRHSTADATEIRRRFPDVRPQPLDEALAATFRWMRDRPSAEAEPSAEI